MTEYLFRRLAYKMRGTVFSANKIRSYAFGSKFTPTALDDKRPFFRDR